MIAGVFHEGSGLGDQLFRYITVRTLAEEKGYEWGMLRGYSGSFKGEDFMKIDYGSHKVFAEVSNGRMKRFEEKVVRDEDGLDIRSYDPEINFVEDNTIIDGSFEDDKYWGHNLANINRWLAVEPLEVPDTTCVVGFRGGEYAANPDLFLDTKYYETAFLQLGVKDYKVHTDDPDLAWSFFRQIPYLKYMDGFNVIPNKPISHSKHTNMGFNWRSARYAKYAIIPNSAFFILPRLLKHFEDPTAVTIAPRYWARRNTKTWARPACYYKPFLYA